MGKLIIIASGKGGTGKTTVTSHVGAVLASMGSLTAVVDADVGFRNLDIALGLESNIVYDYSDYINGNTAFDDILIKSTNPENLYFIAAPQSVHTTDFNDERTELFWNNLKNRFEYVIADAPAGMGDGFMFAAKYADEAIIVSLAETSSLRDADRVIDELEDCGVDTVKLILNRVSSSLIEQKVMMNIDDCMDVLSIPLLGVVPEDKVITESMSKGIPLIDPDNTGAGKAFMNIADRIKGNQVPIMNFDMINRRGIWEKIKKLFAAD